MLIPVVLSLLLCAPLSNGFFFGIIHNLSLSFPSANATITNGTCTECLCAIITDGWNISSFNCFLNNRTCQLFAEPLITSSVTLRNDSTTTIYLLSPPTQVSVDTTVPPSTAKDAMQSSVITTQMPTTTRTTTLITAPLTSTGHLTAMLTSTVGPTTAATTAMPSFVYATPSCSALSNPLVSYTKSTVPTVWRPHQYNITAISTVETVVFRIQTNNKKDFYVDNVNVCPINNPSTSLLVNGDFEQGNAVGWNKYDCTSGCSSPGDIVNSASCLGSWCYLITTSCNDYQILQQSFYASPGQQYTVSFDLIGSAVSGGAGNSLDATVAIV